MASHSSACAAAAAKPSATAVITAARMALLLIMLSPQPRRVHNTYDGQDCHAARECARKVPTSV
jgi:hypothetical protein